MIGIVKKAHKSFAFKKRSYIGKGHCDNDLSLNKNEVRFSFGIYFLDSYHIRLRFRNK